MKKHRICSDGYKWKIQARFLWFFWVDIIEYSSGIIKYFDDKNAAIDTMYILAEQEKKRRATWKAEKAIYNQGEKGDQGDQNNES